MKLYKDKSVWKWLLAVVGFCIVAITMLYAQYLAKNLADREEESVMLYRDAIVSSSTSDPTEDISFEISIIENFPDIPIIIENQKGDLTGYNYSEAEELKDQEFLSKRKKQILRSGYEPIEGTGYASRIYFENSKLFRRISLFPLAQILLLSTFVLIGYYVFSTSRKACLLYTSPSPRDQRGSRMPSSA